MCLMIVHGNMGFDTNEKVTAELSSPVASMSTLTELQKEPKV